MGKRSPIDTTPPDLIIDWANEAERAFMGSALMGPIAPTRTSPRWYDLLEGAAKDDFFGVPAAEPEEPKKEGWQPNGHYWWPSLPPEFGLPRLTHDLRKSTLRTEGLRFRKKYNESGRNYRVGTPEEVYDIHEEQAAIDIHNHDWLDGIFVFPESDRSYNGGLPGALTEEGLRLMDNLPSTPVEEEFDDLPIGGEIFWLMKRAHKARLERLRKKRETEDSQ